MHLVFRAGESPDFAKRLWEGQCRGTGLRVGCDLECGARIAKDGGVGRICRVAWWRRGMTSMGIGMLYGGWPCVLGGEIWAGRGRS